MLSLFDQTVLSYVLDYYVWGQLSFLGSAEVFPKRRSIQVSQVGSESLLAVAVTATDIKLAVGSSSDCCRYQVGSGQ